MVSEQAKKDVRETKSYLDGYVLVEPDLDGNLRRVRRLVRNATEVEANTIENKMQKAVVD